MVPNRSISQSWGTKMGAHLRSLLSPLLQPPQDCLLPALQRWQLLLASLQSKFCSARQLAPC